ncbi:MAG: hypothetical protein IKI65_00260 [Firmicutes bacterium]|nr:hypothetical protein [Bacillota bacterium]
MELIAIDAQLHEIGYLVTDVDIEVGTSDALNNFEMTIPLIDAAGFYAEGTEYGGFFEYISEKSGSSTAKRKGWTWRGLLSQDIIEPPEGSDYRIVSGDANAVLSSLLANVLGGFFAVPDTVSGCTISSYQFPLYVNLLDGISDMLAEYGYRLSIHAEKPAAGDPVAVTVEAVEAETVGGTANEDSPYEITITDDHMGINHLVCMGAGELQNRQRVDLYVGQDGEVSEIQYFTGFSERKAYYDYGSVESLDELKKHGTKRLKELASSKKVEVSAKAGQSIEVGDKVQAALRGNVVVTPIVRKIVKISQGVESVNYKTSKET